MERIRNRLLMLFVVFQTFAYTLLMDAAQVWSADGGGKTLSTMATNLNTDLNNFTSTILWAGMVIGIGLIITGAVKLTKREGEGGVGKAVIFIAAGVLAVGVPALIQLTSGSLLGDSDAASGDVGGVSRK